MKKLSVLLVFWLLTCSLAAQEPEEVLLSRQEPGTFFVEFIGHYFAFNRGDLDGKLVLGNADQVFYIPKINASIDFGLGIGGMLKSGQWSLSYLSSRHEALLQNRERTAVSHLVELNSRTYLLRCMPIRPFVLFGLNFPWLTVKSGSGSGKAVYDATYLGVGVNAGVGALAPLYQRIFLSASVIYRYIGYLYARGPGRGIDVTDLFVDRNGPRRRRYLRAPALGIEISLEYIL